MIMHTDYIGYSDSKDTSFVIYPFILVNISIIKKCY